MSRRRSSRDNDGFLGPLIIVLSIIWCAILAILKSIGIILIAVAAVGALVGIVVAVNNVTKKKKQANEEKQQNLAIVNTPETRHLSAGILS